MKALLPITLSLLLVQGCWTTSTVVLNTERGQPFVREIPLGGETAYRVSSTVEDLGVRVAVTPALCVTRTATPVTEHKVQTTHSSVWTSAILGAIGAGLVGAGTFYWLRRDNLPEYCPASAPDCTTKKVATTGAVVFLGLGAGAIGYGAYRLFQSSEHKELNVEQRTESEQSAQHACKVPADGVLVELQLPGGTVSARTDANGSAWLAIEDSRIAQLQGGVKWQLLVDGTTVNPIVLDPLIAAWKQRNGASGGSKVAAVDPTMLGSFTAVDGCVPGQAYRVADASKLPDDYGQEAPAAELWGCGWNIASARGGLAFPRAVARTSYVIRHYGVFSAPTAGRYTFWLGGALPWRLSIDGRLTLASGGAGYQTIDLTQGEHRMLLEYIYTAGAPFEFSFFSQPPNGQRMPFSLGRGSPYYATQSVRYVGAGQLDAGWRKLATADTREIRIAQQIHFETDSAKIEHKDSSESVLYAVAQILGDHPEIAGVEVQGHTDDVGIDAHNLDLSARRAQSVRGWLITAGIAPHRLAARGYGETRPIAANTTEQGRASNRRVQFVIEGTPRVATVSATASSAPSVAGSAVSGVKSKGPTRHDGALVCDPAGKRFQSLREVDWKNWDGFLKGAWEDCQECAPSEEECTRECEGEQIDDVQLVDVDSDGTLEAINMYSHSGNYSGLCYVAARVFTLKDGCVALLEWPESPALRSGYSDWGFPKVVARNGKIKLTLALGNCRGCVAPDGDGDAEMDAYYRIVSGKLVELKDKATVRKNRRPRR